MPDFTKRAVSENRMEKRCLIYLKQDSEGYSLPDDKSYDMMQILSLENSPAKNNTSLTMQPRIPQQIPL